MSDIDIEEGRVDIIARLQERADSYETAGRLYDAKVALEAARVIASLAQDAPESSTSPSAIPARVHHDPNATAMFDAIETGRQWETIARRLADECKHHAGHQCSIGYAYLAFRDIATRTSTPSDGPS